MPDDDQPFRGLLFGAIFSLPFWALLFVMWRWLR